MHYFRSYRSISFCLLILVLSFITTQAQDTTNVITETASSEASSSEASPADKSPSKVLSTDTSAKNLFKDSPETTAKDSRETVSPDFKAITRNKTRRDRLGVGSEIGFWGGVSTIAKDLAGEPAGQRFGMFAIRYSVILKDNPRIKLKYLIDFVPVAVINYRRERRFRTSPTTTTVTRDRQTVFGVGYNPFGFQVNFRNRQKFQPFIAGGGGLFLFTKRVPDNRTELEPRNVGNKFQLTADFGAGVEIMRSEKKSYVIGYKYHHISNAYTAPKNVGYNSNMIYFGMNFGL